MILRSLELERLRRTCSGSWSVECGSGWMGGEEETREVSGGGGCP